MSAGCRHASVALALALVVLSPVLAGCLGLGGDDASPAAPAATDGKRLDDGEPDPANAFPCGLHVAWSAPSVVAGRPVTATVSVKNCGETDLLFRGDACSGAAALVLTRDGRETGPGSPREPWILDADGAPSLGQRICPDLDKRPLVLAPGSAASRAVVWNGTVSERKCVDRECWLAFAPAEAGPYHVGSRVTILDTTSRDAPPETLQAAAALRVDPDPDALPPPPPHYERFRALGRGSVPGADPTALVIETTTAWTSFWQKAHDDTLLRAPPVDFARERVLVVILGDRPVACADVEVSSVHTDVALRETRIVVRERAPANASACPAEVTNPWTAVAIRAHPTKVRLARETVTADWVPIATLAAGAHSSVAENATLVVENATAWAALWARHDPARPAPDVNFTRDRVLAAFMGERSTGGYDVRVKSPRVVDGTLVAEVLLLGPEPGQATTEAATRPFHFAVVPAGDEPVRFVVDRRDGP